MTDEQKNMKKKLVVLCMVMAMVFSLAACSKDDDKKKASPTEPPVTKTESEATPTEEAKTTEGAEEVTSAPATVDIEPTSAEPEVTTEPEITAEPEVTDVEPEPTESLVDDEGGEGKEGGETADNSVLEAIFSQVDMTKHAEDIADMTLVMDIALNMEYPTGDGTTTPVTVKANGTINIEGNKTTAHASGSMDMDMMGQAQNTALDSWVTASDDGKYTGYTFVPESNIWVKAATDSMTYNASMVSSLSADMFAEAEVSETETDYIITGKMDMNKMGDVVSGNDMLGSLGVSGDSLSAGLVDAVITINKATMEITSMAFDLKGAMGTLESFGMTCDTCTMTIQVNGFSEGEFTVPEDIVANAMDMAAVQQYDIQYDVEEDAA